VSPGWWLFEYQINKIFESLRNTAQDEVLNASICRLALAWHSSASFSIKAPILEKALVACSFVFF